MREREREGSDCFKIVGFPHSAKEQISAAIINAQTCPPFCAEANLATAHVGVKAGGTQTSRSTICTIYIRTARGNSSAR